MESTSPSDLPFFTFCFFTGEQKLGLCCVLVRWQASAAVWWHASNELNFSNETLMVTYGSIEACDYIIYTYILHYSILVWTGRSDISLFLLILNDLFSAPGKKVAIPVATAKAGVQLLLEMPLFLKGCGGSQYVRQYCTCCAGVCCLGSWSIIGITSWSFEPFSVHCWTCVGLRSSPYSEVFCYRPRVFTWLLVSRHLPSCLRTRPLRGQVSVGFVSFCADDLSQTHNMMVEVETIFQFHPIFSKHFQRIHVIIVDASL